MNVKTFIENEFERLKFISALTLLLYEEGSNSKGCTIDVDDISNLDQEDIKNTMKVRKRSFTDFYAYEKEMVIALNQVAMVEKNKNLLDECITCVGFRHLEYEADYNDVIVYVRIEMRIDGESLILYHFRHYFDFHKTEKIRIKGDNYKGDNCRNVKCKIANKIYYDNELILAEENSEEINRLRLENEELKRQIVCEILSKFLPRDLISIVLSFDPLNYCVVFDY